MSKITFFRRCLLTLTICLTVPACQDSGTADNRAIKSELVSTREYLKIGEHRKALTAARRALRKSPGHPEAELALASVYTALGELDLAAELINRHPQEQHQFKLVKLLRAQIDNGEFDAAAYTLKQNQWLQQRSAAEYRLALAGILRGYGRFDEAEVYIDRAGGTDMPRENLLDERIELALAEEKPDQARGYVRELLKQSRPNVRAFTLAARVALANNDADRASRYINAAQDRIKPTDTMTLQQKRVHKLTMDIYRLTGQEVKARELAKQLARQSPRASARNQQALDIIRTALQEEQINEARAQADKLCTQDRKQQLCHALKAVLATLSGDHAYAATLLATDTEGRDMDPKLLQLAALNQLLLNRLDRSEALFSRVKTDSSGKTLSAIQTAAWEAHKSRQTFTPLRAKQSELVQKSLPNLQALLGANAQLWSRRPPPSAPVLDWHAYFDSILLSSGKRGLGNAAVMLAEEAQSEAQFSLISQALLSADEPEAAEQVLLSKLRRQPNDVAARLAISNALLDQGRTENAVAVLRELIKAQPEALHAYARLYQLVENLDGNKAALELMISLVNDAELQPWAGLALANVYADQGKWEQGQATLDGLDIGMAAAEHAANTTQARLWLAAANSTEPGAAVGLLEKAWELSGHEGLSTALYRHYSKYAPGRLPEFLQRWRLNSDRSPRSLAASAAYASSTGQDEQAKRYYELAIEKKPGFAAAINNLALLYLEQEPDKALELARQAYQLAPERAFALDTYGNMLVTANQKERGKILLNKARSLN